MAPRRPQDERWTVDIGLLACGGRSVRISDSRRYLGDERYGSEGLATIRWMAECGNPPDRRVRLDHSPSPTRELLGAIQPRRGGTTVAWATGESPGLSHDSIVAHRPSSDTQTTSSPCGAGFEQLREKSSSSRSRSAFTSHPSKVKAAPRVPQPGNNRGPQECCSPHLGIPCGGHL
jgi:hypothetical protein